MIGFLLGWNELRIQIKLFTAWKLIIIIVIIQGLFGK